MDVVKCLRMRFVILLMDAIWTAPFLKIFRFKIPSHWSKTYTLLAKISFLGRSPFSFSAYCSLFSFAPSSFLHCFHFFTFNVRKSISNGERPVQKHEQCTIIFFRTVFFFTVLACSVGSNFCHCSLSDFQRFCFQV